MSAGGADTPPVDQSLTEAEKVKLYVDVWKQTVEVQKHFNDLEWRIRGLALTAATFALGASALAAKDRTTVGPVSVGSIVLLAGVLLWYAFYFADRYWYHPLLIASVRHGEQLEEELRAVLPAVGLTRDISAGSPISPPIFLFWRKKNLHSSDKLRYFYGIGAAVLVTAAVLLQVAACFAAPSVSAPVQSSCCCPHSVPPPTADPAPPSPTVSPATPGTQSNSPDPGPADSLPPGLPPVSPGK